MHLEQATHVVEIAAVDANAYLTVTKIFLDTSYQCPFELSLLNYIDCFDIATSVLFKLGFAFSSLDQFFYKILE